MMFLKFKISALILLSCFFVQADYLTISPEERKEMLEAGFPPEMIDLGEAAVNNDVKRIRKLVREGTDPNVRGPEGNTFLHYVFEPAIIETLLKAGADPNAINSRGSTPLHVNLEPAAIEALLNAGADPNARDNNGKTSLHVNHEPAAIEALLNAGADPNARDKNGKISLHANYVNYEPATIEALLKAGADPNARDKNGGTPLHFNHAPAAIEALLKAGADPNARDKNGETPLHRTSNRKGIKVLLNAGADPNAARNKDGKSPASFNNLVQETLKQIEQEREAPQRQAAVRQFEQEREASPVNSNFDCKYNQLSKIHNNQCSRKILCLTEISCKITLGKLRTTETFPSVCSALANGECPTATNCALDRSFAEVNEQTNNGAAASSSSSSQSSKGVR